MPSHPSPKLRTREKQTHIGITTVKLEALQKVRRRGMRETDDG